MGTRTNFYKNPSITYKKDLSLSSVLQNLKGRASPTDMSKVPHRHLTAKNDISHH
ncbi:unnamed protein product, partial [Prunus brigantina]